MSDFPPVKMTLFKTYNETDNKVRWDAIIGDAVFQLYIPKWRVPSPWPKKISVTISIISDDSEITTSRITPDQCADDSMFAKTAINAIVQKNCDHTMTVRYDPVGHPADWEIGSPYIPYSLTHNEANKLRLTVKWDDPIERNS